MDDSGSQSRQVSRDDINIVVIMDLCMFLVNIFSPLAVYLLKRQDSAFIRDQSVENINMWISLIIYGAISAVLSFVLIGFVGYILIWVYSVVTIILAAKSNGDGKLYRYPYIFRLVK